MATIYKQPGSNNIVLGDLLHTIAACYRYLGSEYRMKVKAYTAASRTIHGLNLDIATYVGRAGDLCRLRGIDENIAREILEYLKKGKIKTFEQLTKKVPVRLLELMDINGIGPSTIKLIHDKLHVNNREEMIVALLSGALDKIESIGQNKIEQMKRGLKLYRESRPELFLSEAVATADDISKILMAMPGVANVAVCGSIRRKKETIGNIDILVKTGRQYSAGIIKRFCNLSFVHRVIIACGKRISVLLKRHNTQVDIHLVNEYEYGAALLYLTGSKEHNIALKKWAYKKGFLLNEHGLFDKDTGKWLAGKTEEDVYELLRLQFVPPELRENRGEIEKAGKHRLPVLIKETDIKGNMSLHSSWSNADEDIETLARMVLKLYPQYEYIVISDYLYTKPGLAGLQPEDLIEQFTEIDFVNKSLGRNLIKKGVDVPILNDGLPALPDTTLQQFDWVAASIYDGINKDNTKRLLKACENPFVHCLNHPGHANDDKDTYSVNWNLLFEKAAITGTCLAINANPNKPGFKDTLVHAAIEKGVRICIGSDACDLKQLEYMSLGVAVAERGWCTTANVLNSCCWQDIEYYKRYKLNRLHRV